MEQYIQQCFYSIASYQNNYQMISKSFLRNIFVNMFAVTATMLLLVSCAIGPSFKEHSEQLSQLPEDKARLYVYRPSNRGSSIKPNIKLDGKVVGQSVAKGFIVLDIDPGVHTLTTSDDSSWRFSFFLKKAEEHYIRLEIKRGFAVNQVSPKLVDFDVGSAEIVNTAFAGR